MPLCRSHLHLLVCGSLWGCSQAGEATHSPDAPATLQQDITAEDIRLEIAAPIGEIVVEGNVLTVSQDAKTITVSDGASMTVAGAGPLVAEADHIRVDVESQSISLQGHVTSKVPFRSFPVLEGAR